MYSTSSNSMLLSSPTPGIDDHLYFDYQTISSFPQDAFFKDHLDLLISRIELDVSQFRKFKFVCHPIDFDKSPVRRMNTPSGMKRVISDSFSPTDVETWSLKRALYDFNKKEQELDHFLVLACITDTPKRMERYKYKTNHHEYAVALTTAIAAHFCSHPSSISNLTDIIHKNEYSNLGCASLVGMYVDKNEFLPGQENKSSY